MPTKLSEFMQLCETSKQIDAQDDADYLASIVESAAQACNEVASLGLSKEEDE